MDTYFELVKSAEQLKRIFEEKFYSNTYLGVDTETTSLDPYDGNLRLIQISNEKDTIIIDLNYFAETKNLKQNQALEPLRKILQDPEKIKFIHNAKFDIKWIQHHLGIKVKGVFDTMLASQLIHAGDPEKKHSLAEVANFFLKIEVGKEEQKSDWSVPQLTESQLKYAATDALVAFRLGRKIEEALNNEALMKTAKIEFDCIAPLAKIETNGIYLDTNLWDIKTEQIRHKLKDLSEKLERALSDLNSQSTLFSGTSQVNLDDLNKVCSLLGISTFSQKNLNRELRQLSMKNHIASDFLEYLELKNILSEFGRNFLNYVNHRTQRLHPDYKQIGTFAGYIKCYKPNLNIIPDAYLECLSSPQERKIVSVFYPDIEFRVLAELSQDTNLRETLTQDTDFNKALALRLFKLKPTQVTDDHILLVKRLNLAIIYGAGSSYLAELNGIDKKEAEELLKTFFLLYQKLWQWLEKVAQKARMERLCRSISGRIYRLEFETEERIRRYARSFQALALSADIMKRGLYLLDEELEKSSAKIIHIFQHGFLIECDSKETEEIVELARKTLKKAAEEFLSYVPIQVESKESDFWSS